MMQLLLVWVLVTSWLVLDCSHAVPSPIKEEVKVHEDIENIIVRRDLREDTAKEIGNEIRSRYKRSASDGHLTVEVAVFVDQKMKDYIDDLFMKTNNSNVVEHRRIFWIMKLWSEVQQEFYHQDLTESGINITLKIMKVEFVSSTDEPGKTYNEWYADENTRTISLSKGRSFFCNYVESSDENKQYDILYMHTGASNTDYAGLADTPGGACHQNLCNRCLISVSGARPKLIAHEVGHTLNMRHDADHNKPDECNGIMGQGEGWSPCSIVDLETFLYSDDSNCLIVNNVESPSSNIVTFDVKKNWPGIFLTVDDICMFRFGHNYIFGDLDHDGDFCGKYTCKSLTSKDVKTVSEPMQGLYCKDRRSCVKNKQCLTIEKIRMDHPEFREEWYNPSSEQWGEWTSVGQWEGKCGEKGIFINKKRTCDHTMACSKPCQGKHNIQGRTGKVKCVSGTDSNNSRRKREALCESTGYLSERGNGNCVKVCTNGHNVTEETGTACKPEQKKYVADQRKKLNEADLNNFDFGRITGHQGTCHVEDKYYECKTSDCKGYLDGSNIFDGCGVCNGDNTTCRVKSHKFTNETIKGVRITLTIFPIGSYDIQCWFYFPAMKGNFLEMWFTNGTAILTDVFNVKYYDNDKVRYRFYWGGNTKIGEYQYLTTSNRPLTAEAELKLLSKWGKANKGIRCDYSIHTEYANKLKELQEVRAEKKEWEKPKGFTEDEINEWLAKKQDLDVREKELIETVNAIETTIEKSRKI